MSTSKQGITVGTEKAMTLLVGYGRVSAEIQEHNTSLGNQRQKCALTAAIKDCELVNADDDDCFEQAPGGDLWRPGLWKALEQMKCLKCEPRPMPMDRNLGWFKAKCQCGKMKGADGMVVNSLDRLSRSTSDLIFLMNDVFRANGKRLIVANGDMSFDTGTPSGALVFGLFALLAEFDKNTFKEKMAQAKTAGKAQGRHVEGIAPYGFYVRPKTKAHNADGMMIMLPPMLMLADNEVATIKAILLLFYMRVSIREITRRLNASIKESLPGEGYRPRKAKEWNFKQVWRIIHGPQGQMHQALVRDSYNQWHKEAQEQAKAQLGKIAKVERLITFKD